MTDLVDRLRYFAKKNGGLDGPLLAREAADEIDRLHRDRIAGEAVITKLSFALTRGEAEIERLREALRDVLSAFSFWQTLDPAGPRDENETERFVHDIEAAITRARAALEPKP